MRSLPNLLIWVCYAVMVITVRNPNLSDSAITLLIMSIFAIGYTLWIVRNVYIHGVRKFRIWIAVVTLWWVVVIIQLRLFLT